jgi:PAS domain S-box-containing protein
MTNDVETDRSDAGLRLRRALEECARLEGIRRAAEERQTFLLRLDDAVRPLGGAHAIVRETTRQLADHLDARRCHFAEVEADGVHYVIRDGFVRGTASRDGRFRLDEYGEAQMEALRSGRTIVSGDVQQAKVAAQIIPQVAIPQVNIPLVKAGRLVAILGIDAAEPRSWSDDDIELVKQVAERAWAAVERAHAETALHQSEARVRALVAASTNLTTNAPTNATTYATYRMSADWREMRHLDGGGFIADTPDPTTRWLERYIQPEDHPRILDAIGQAIRTRSPFELEHRVRRPDGTLAWTLSRAVPIQDDAGTIVEWFGAATDITARRAATETLQESEERYRSQLQTAERRAAELHAVLESIGDAVYMGGPNGITLVNRPALDQLGFTSSEELNRAVAVLAEEIQTRDPDTGTFIPAEEQAFIRALSGERVVRDVLVRHRLTGEDRVLRSSAAPVVLDGRVIAAVAVNTDITDRTKAEELLRESEARFRHLADSAPALIWMSDAAGRIIFANMHHDHLFGRPAAAMLDDGWFDMVIPEDREPFIAAYRLAFAARRPFSTESRVTDAAGRIRWLRCEGVPRLDDARLFLGYTGCNVDITEARLATEELEARVAERTAELMAAEETIRQAQKMEAVGQLTGGIAHDFNNMLQGIGGAIELAARRIRQDRSADAARYLDAAHEAVDRAAGLTHRLLAFARRQRLEPEQVDANQLIADLADLIRRTMGPDIAVELDLREGLGSVLCDRNALENTLLNLCINARDAMPDGGRLILGVDVATLSAADIRPDEVAPGRYSVISVVDTGTGMPPDVLARVFEPFFTTKPQGQGTGLGLSQAYGFVRQSGGLMRIDSSPDQGATVRLFLPLHDRIAVAETPQPPATPEIERPRSTRTLLLVDDETSVRHSAADHLREFGYTVLEARDGPEALRILDTVRPDMLVTDVGLPGGMNGRQIAEVAREKAPGLPVLFITGYAGISLPPGMEIIGKPFKLDTLAARVQAILEDA